MKANVLKALVLSYKRGDDRGFRAAMAQIIEEERKKRHPVLADELERLLNGSNGLKEANIPKDDKGNPLLEVKKPERHLKELVLGLPIRNAIDLLVEEFRSWETLEANGLKPTQRILFCGPSGCGKTATAEAIAAELGLPLLYVRFDSVVSSLLGETPKNLRKVFDYAQREQWIVFFDEFDAIGRSRDNPTEHGEIKRVVNSFLQILDGFQGKSLLIAATNFEQEIDPAVWRRFDDVIRFDKPTSEQIQLLIKKLLQPLQFDDAHVNELAKELDRATYADAERVCLSIRKLCAMRGIPKVQAQDIAGALSRYIYRRAILANGKNDIANISG